jgi:hypothetical protein
MSTACNIKAYRVSPSEPKETVPSDSSPKHLVLYFNVPQILEEKTSVPSRQEPLVRAQLFASMLGQTLIDNPSFKAAVLASGPPDKGLYVGVTVRGENHLTLSSALYLLLSSFTLTLIPLYADDVAEYVITYQLFRDGEPVQMYQHRVQQKTLIWMGVLLAVPFLHDSWTTAPWTAPKEKAFSETARLFWLEGHRDGYF